MPCPVQKNGVESDEQLRQRFQKEILPKIQEQLKGLDQNEQPNNATIELKRQLRVRSRPSTAVNTAVTYLIDCERLLELAQQVVQGFRCIGRPQDLRRRRAVHHASKQLVLLPRTATDMILPSSVLLQRVEDDIYRLLDDLKENKSEAARAEAAGLAREFEDIRNYVKENGGMLADEAKAE